MKPGETMFGGGAGVIFLGRRSRPASVVDQETQQVPETPQQNEPAAAEGNGTPARHQEPDQNAALHTGESKTQ